MDMDTQAVEIGGRRLRLTNLGKVLYPDEGITKAEVIRYYLQVAPYMLRHVSRRPLSVIRYPEGIDGQNFFQKNRPDHAPDWIEHVLIGSDKQLDYMMANSEAALAWFGNMAALELHQWHSRAPAFDQPDNIVFDVDPPESWRFEEVVALALQLREEVEAFGYTPFVKTSGKKGIHLHVPVQPRWSYDEAFEASKAVAASFISKNKTRATLQIAKNRRQEKALIDVYRNRPGQTIICPYSLRAAAGAPVAMPLSWDEIAGLADPRDFNLHSAAEKARNDLDPWEGMDAFAAELHTQRKAISSVEVRVDERLQPYAEKRDFKKTTEPAGQGVQPASGDRFVVHRHHARRLHYDLRLAWNGVLRSWAIPKGLPPRPGIKRLAVQTEDHPIEYLDFEGTIAAGEYGAGKMWVFAAGRYEIQKEKKDSLYFNLIAPGMEGSYRIYQTDGKNHLIERLDEPHPDWLHHLPEPMKAVAQAQLPQKGDYVYEVKWDGIRALITVDEGEVRIHTRNHVEVTRQFSELVDAGHLRATSAVLDGEIVCFDAEGKPDFAGIVQRIQRSGRSFIKGGNCATSAICFLFDCLYLDGRVTASEPLERRREWVADIIRPQTPYQLSKDYEDARSLWDGVLALGLEGIVAKKKGSPYRAGKRSDDWLKIKVRQSIECRVVGYTQGKGSRGKGVGALLLAEYEGDRLVYRGRVGTGFSDVDLAQLTAFLKDLPPLEELPEEAEDSKEAVWVEPALVCEVAYTSKTRAGRLRDPVYLRLRPDLMELQKG